MRKKFDIFNFKLNKKLVFFLFPILVLVGVKVISADKKIFQVLGNKTKEIIVVDPGHGGIDGGTSDSDGLLEKDVNLDIGLKLKKELEKGGFKVVMTREKDKSLEEYSDINASRYRRDLNARKTIINENEPKVFISIHVNSSKRPNARGVQVYYYPTSEEGKKLASSICISMDEIVYKDHLKDSNLETQFMPENFFILRETDGVGVLVEVGFITNPEDNKLLKDNRYKKKIAKAISEGIKKYITD